MSTWQGAWFLAKEELRRIRWRHLLTVLYIGYMLLFIVPMFDAALDGEDSGTAYWAMDFLIVGLLPFLGLMSTQTNFYWRTDCYTKKLIAWRSLPISIKQISLGRLLIFLLIIMPALILFFGLLYIGVHSLNNGIAVGSFILFALFWSSYAVTAGFLYLYFQMSCTGKQYLWFCTIFTIVIMIALLLYSVVFQASLFVAIYEACAGGGGWIAPIAVAVAVLAGWGGVPFIGKSVSRRDLSR